MSNDIAIRVDDVTKIYKLYDRNRDRLRDSLGLTRKPRYKEHYALHNISFDVHKGECIGIIGTNGAGKSTILKIITGVLAPSSGNVEIDGRISALLELGAGFNMEYTGIENVYLNGTMIGFSKEEIDAKLDSILEFADIGDFVNQPVKTYSSGMFVRLAFAVAINIDPEILIVDEALSVGDVFFQAKCFKKFEEFKENGKTILFVSHDLGSIRKYCDRAILLDKGRMIGDDEPPKIIDLYKKALVGQLDTNSEEGSNEDGSGSDMSEPQVWKESLQVNPTLEEYGDKEIEIIDYAVIDDLGNYTNTLSKGEDFQIKVKIKANEEVHSPIVAFTIKDLKGTDITGTNTTYEGIDMGILKSGDERTVTFRQKMNLQGAQYLVSFGCTRFTGNEFQVCHRLYDAINLEVISDKNTVGYYDIESEVTIE